jgi:hypothetical protein
MCSQARTEHDLLEVISAIDPSLCSYEEWVQVGMALKDAGCSPWDWDAWSRRDAKRYHEGECAKKWESFRGSATPVTGGTVVALARSQGWTPPADDGYALEWDDIIGPRDERALIPDTAWVEAEDVPEPAVWDPVREIVTYLSALFGSEENVGYVTKAWERDGRFVPQKGSWDRSAGELIDALSRCDGDIGAVLGDYRPEVGAWIRFNPLDGRGCKNENVTEFRYALVESDTMPIDKQNAIIRQLELPVAALVHSGGKSLHAIVRIDAPTYDEYRKRVDYLYATCRRNGLAIDAQNKNPSRLSRLPGVERAGRKQFLAATNIGRETWAEWQAWIETSTDELPEPRQLSDVWDAMPDLDEPIIEGILRRGHKMLLSGGSKDGKSFALIELAIAIAEGREWLGWPCAKGRAMYVNLEVAEASCLHRFKDVYEGLGWSPDNIDKVTIWNLRGKALAVEHLVPKLMRRIIGKGYSTVIIDPIYKISGGDENSASDMARFCNHLDVVARETGCAIVYCHHHSKGAQGQKRSMDRASGSGVFARDADALIDFVRLDVTKSIIEQQINDRTCERIARWLHSRQVSWREEISQDARVVAKAFRSEVAQLFDKAGEREVMNVLIGELAELEKDVRAHKALRVEGTLREFRPFEPVDIWFRHPVHQIDTLGVLKDLKSDGEQQPWEKAADKRKETAGKERANKRAELERAVAESNFGEPPTQEQIAEFLGVSKRTVTRRIRDHGGFSTGEGDPDYAVRRKGPEASE